MELRNLSDKQLLENTEALIRQEREILIEVLKHLREIDRRRLYSEKGYKSINEFVMGVYGYDKDKASRRISAMRLMTQVPELEKKIESGSISLTHIRIAQNLFRHEAVNHDNKFTADRKLEVLQQLEHTSTREAQRLAFGLASSPIVHTVDQIRDVGIDRIEIKFSAPAAVEQMLEKLKGFFAHKNPSMTTAELVQRLCELGIKTWDPAMRKTKGLHAANVKIVDKKIAARLFCTEHLRIRIPAAIRTEVWRKCRSKCVKCGSMRALQIDHIKPLALGGTDEVENLRLLCRSCNQRAAIKTFGMNQMDTYIGGYEG